MSVERAHGVQEMEILPVGGGLAGWHVGLVGKLEPFDMAHSKRLHR